MDRHEQLISARYDALLFARTPDNARKAARELVEVVLGEEAVDLPLEETLRQVCRKIRPAADPRDQARFESEFLELVIVPVTENAPAETAPSQSELTHIRNNRRIAA